MAETSVVEPAKSIFISFSFHDKIDCFRFAGLYIKAMIDMARAPQAGKSAFCAWIDKRRALLTEVDPETKSPGQFCGIREDSSK